MTATQRKRVALALQGGGAHGAYTWGVLDRLLEDGRVEITHVSGASAGAMNAIVLANGLAKGGAPQARAELDQFWQSIAGVTRYLPNIVPLRGDALSELLSGQVALDIIQRLVPPALANPMGYNPLRELVAGSVDFAALNAADSNAPQVMVSATSVTTGRGRVFTNGELSADAVAASACLPQLFAPVTIDGEAYWDGGFADNPPLASLMAAGADDTLVVQLNPDRIDRMPRTASEIAARMSQISFNASLLVKAQWVEQVNRLIDDGALQPGDGLQTMRLHRIGADGMESLTAASKMFPDWHNLQELKEMGRRHADTWLAQAFPKVGVESTWQPGLLAGVEAVRKSQARNTPEAAAPARSTPAMAAGV